MNSSNNPTDTTRRSFIKLSVVAAVAVSSMTIFSGLVKAEGEDGSATACFPAPPMQVSEVDSGIIHEFPDHSRHKVYDCTATGGGGCCSPTVTKCGKYSAGTPNGASLVDVILKSGSTVKCYR